MQAIVPNQNSNHLQHHDNSFC